MPSDKELKFELTADELTQVRGHVMTVTFKAKYVDNITDDAVEESYVGVKTLAEDETMTENGDQVSAEDADAAHIGTPNQAKVKVGDHEAWTNTVTVTAPPDVPSPEKSVGESADAQKALEHDEDGNVTNQPNLKLEGREDTFTYSVTQEIPASLNLKSISFSDTIENVLEFIPASNANAKVVDETDANIDIDVKIEGQTITATPKSIEGLTGKKLTFTFDAKIKAGVTDDQLRTAGYVNNSIPNKATVNVNGSPIGTNEVLVTPPSEEEVPEKLILTDEEAKADEAEAHKGTSTLVTRPEEFTYTINQKVPTGAYYLEFTDTLVEVLEFVDKSATAGATLTADGETVTGAEITASGNKITAKVGSETAPAEGTESLIKDLEGKTVALTFKAKLRDDVKDDDLYGKYLENSLNVPNEATVKVNDNPLNTNKVWVTPPPENPEEPEKFVEGEKYGTPSEELKEGETEKDAYSLAKRFAEVTYTIVQKVPAMAENVQFIDQLERVLEVTKVAEGEDAGNYTFAKDADGNNLKVAVEDADGNPISKAVVRVIGNLVMATIDDADTLESLTNKDVVLRIAAKLRDNVTDQELIDEYGDGREIPNEATVIIGNNSGTTNKVKIVPSEEPEEPVKAVEADGIKTTDEDGEEIVIKGTTNDAKTFATLAARSETFTYTVTQKVPENADTVAFWDMLEPVLEVIKNGDAWEVSVDGKASYDIKVEEVTHKEADDEGNLIDDPVFDPEGNELKSYIVTAETDDATLDRGKVVTLTIKAKIRDGISDEYLIDMYNSTNIPNTAVVTIDDLPGVTNEVEVTPPPVESEEPEKKVEGKTEHELEAEDPTDATSIEEARKKTFEYTISQKVPDGAITLSFEDTLASVLELVYEGENVAAKITDEDGNEVPATYTVDKTTVTERETDSETVILKAEVTDKAKLAELKDKTVTLSFTAKIKDDVLDGELIEKFGSTRIPNKATVLINGNGLRAKSLRRR